MQWLRLLLMGDIVDSQSGTILWVRRCALILGCILVILGLVSGLRGILILLAVRGSLVIVQVLQIQ